MQGTGLGVGDTRCYRTDFYMKELMIQLAMEGMDLEPEVTVAIPQL